MEWAAVITASIAAFVSILSLLLNRKWQKDDKNSEAKDECEKTLKRIEKKLDAHIEADALDSVRQCRARIIVFADEITRGLPHSKEHYDCIRDDADYYDRYCSEHPKYPNRKAEAAKALIDKTYDEHLQLGDWLQ